MISYLEPIVVERELTYVIISHLVTGIPASSRSTDTGTGSGNKRVFKLFYLKITNIII